MQELAPPLLLLLLHHYKLMGTPSQKKDDAHAEACQAIGVSFIPLAVVTIMVVGVHERS